MIGPSYPGCFGCWQPRYPLTASAVSCHAVSCTGPMFFCGPCWMAIRDMIRTDRAALAAIASQTNIKLLRVASVLAQSYQRRAALARRIETLMSMEEESHHGAVQTA